MKIRLSHPTGILEGKLSYGGSKSISNRVLIIQHLCKGDFTIENLSKSDDTKSLQAILGNISNVNDVHHAGTTFRFLTSLFAFTDGDQTLTGSERMLQRPIGPLVEALNDLGANISYKDVVGYPPLLINSPSNDVGHEVSIDGGVSSQYLSSLLLIAPTLPKGLKLTILGELVSRPYLQMTLSIMEYFGIKYHWKDNKITILPKEYIATDFYVESDWSSASYYFSLAALSNRTNISISGLRSKSLQADAEIKYIAAAFRVKHTFGEVLTITKEEGEVISTFIEQDFISCPDIAQTVFVMCGALNVKGLFKGLQTLKIKETDRITACATELAKVGVYLTKVPQRFAQRSQAEMYMLDGELSINEPVFDTYNDHRMAMAFAPLALLSPITFNDAHVISKSYPTFWTDLEKLGFKVEHQ